MLVEVTYAIYLLVSLSIIICISRIYSRSGYVYLFECLGRNEHFARSINNLLLVGFYLVNLGFITLSLKYGEKPETTLGAIEFLSTKIGTVLIVLGLFHFFNMKVIQGYGNRKEKTTVFGLKDRVSSTMDTH